MTDLLEVQHTHTEHTLYRFCVLCLSSFCRSRHYRSSSPLCNGGTTPQSCSTATLGTKADGCTECSVQPRAICSGNECIMADCLQDVNFVVLIIVTTAFHVLYNIYVCSWLVKHTTSVWTYRVKCSQTESIFR